MKLPPLAIALTLVVGVGLALEMKTSKSASVPTATPNTAACAVDAAKSACGLPSNVVIDRSKTKVQRTDAAWKKLLTPIQFRVAREQGTEPPFRNEFWDNHADGVYFSVCSDTPLFDSRDKFESGTGWPSFTRPIDPQHVLGIEDNSYGMHRVETRCARCDSHQGHVFPDGPPPTRLRYCINSVSLQFVATGDALPDPLHRAEKLAA